VTVMTLVVAQSPRPASASEQRDAARRLLGIGLERAFGVPPADVEVERTSDGKPRLLGRRDVHFNIAHCPAAVAVAVADQAVGVDVEEIRARDPYVAARCFDASELDRVEAATDPDREFFRYWTLKESYVKALGTGLSHPLRSVRFAVSADGEPESDLRAGFRLVEQFPGVIVALCWLQRRASVHPDLVHVEW